MNKEIVDSIDSRLSELRAAISTLSEARHILTAGRPSPVCVGVDGATTLAGTGGASSSEGSGSSTVTINAVPGSGGVNPGHANQVECIRRTVAAAKKPVTAAVLVAALKKCNHTPSGIRNAIDRAWKTGAIRRVSHGVYALPAADAAASNAEVGKARRRESAWVGGAAARLKYATIGAAIRGELKAAGTPLHRSALVATCVGLGWAPDSVRQALKLLTAGKKVRRVSRGVYTI